MFLPSLVLALLAAADPPPQAASIATIEELWSGFDPRAAPLDLEVVKSWDEGEVHLETFYFTGEVFEGEAVRVFGHFGRPAQARGLVPGVLHVHGGGQTASLDWTRFWAKRGYACLSFDYCGDANVAGQGPGPRRERYTRWGKVPADMMKVGGGLSMTPSARYNPWYHWTLVARRGLTVLESRPGVDGEKLGVFGISVGGTLTWSIAALDSRVKAAAPIYGCGWEFYPYPPDESAPVTDDLKLWRRLIAPEAHAASIRCPVFLLSATNDFHGRMDLAFRTLDRVPARVKGQVFSANYDHHVEPAEARSLPLFMDAHLKGAGGPWPASPRVEVDASDGVPVVRVVAADPDRVERADLYYCLNNAWPTARFWRSIADVHRQGDGFAGPAPFLTTTDVLHAFASITYSSGVRISSRLFTRPVASLAGVRPTLERQSLVDAMETPRDWAWVPAFTDPCREGRFFAEWSGPDGRRGFTLDPDMFPRSRPMPFHFGTRKVGDPQFSGEGRKALLLDHLAAHVPDRVTVRLSYRPPDQNPTEYSSVLPAAIGEGDWRTWRMEPGQFRDIAGHRLPGWDRVDRFVLEGSSPAHRPPVFRNLRWADE
ncbi:alpha/beta hydrolase family protein [Aquisphaera insulae]|uniref:alpha/beta hydrolase family protein n=1 Tax=Aquisphaera insulae TaxID=2712864 RepID=UPI0013E9F3B9|nr:acetylxylan esterase [Aquisphaera insulae]